MEAISQYGMGGPVDYLERLYRNHYRGAWLRSGASLFMWTFAFVAYQLYLIKINNLAGISASVAFLVLMNPALLWILKRLKSQRLSDLFSFFIILLEIIGYTSVIYFMGGIRALWLSPIYAVLINYVGIMGPRKLPFIIAGFCGAVMALAVAMEYMGFLPSQDPIQNLRMSGMHQAAIVVTVAVYLYIVAFVSAYAGDLLKTSKRKLRAQNLELEDKNRRLELTEKELTMAHQKLEIRVEERTAELKKANKRMEREINERMQTERALVESEEKYRLHFENASDVIYSIDTEFKVRSVSPSVEKTIGYSPEELIGQPFPELNVLAPEYLEAAVSDTMRLLSDERVSVSVYEFIAKDGTRKIGEVSGAPVFRDGKVTELISVARDITDRVKAERALQESEEKFRTLFEFAPDAYYLNDLEGCFLEGNKAAEELIGYKREELIGKNFLQLDLLTPEQLPKAVELLKKNIEGQSTGPDELILRRKDGVQILAEIRTILIKIKDKSVVLGVARNITEQRRLEDQLRQSQKMEAIGTLSGGMAHEFNNILGIIIGNTELAIDDVPEWNPAKECLKEIRAASLRAKDVVRHILSFARKSHIERKPVQIARIIEDTLKLMRASIPTTIDIQQSILCKYDAVLADPTQINQVLMNLCTNAAYAMREEGGVLEVKLQDTKLDGNMAAQYGGLAPGRYVRLTVRDTGQGIDPEIMDRIFDPFFTTKGLAEGTGMGLSVVHGIVKSHDGAIKVKSEPGHGTIIEVLLPLIEADAEATGEEFEFFPTGTERILFVDDDLSIVKIAAQMLERLDYEVTTKTSSVEALELFEAEPDRFDLVITDMTMPHMTGDRLAQKLFMIRSDIPVILCTGYSERIDEDKAKEMGIRAFALKPLVMRDLANIIRKVLDIKY